MLRKLIAAALLMAVTGTAAGVAYASNDHGGLAGLKRATAKYHNLNTAISAGYGKLVDLNGIACIDMPGMGAMGIHYVNGKYLTDVLNVIKEAQVMLETTSPSSPGVIKPVGSDNYIHVVMPMFVQW